MQISASTPLILFDGLCNLCNSSVQFVLRHDKKKVFHFASLQGANGKEYLKKHKLPETQLNSFILVEGDVLYTRSTAALRVCKKLGGGWPLLYAAIWIPPFIRDGIYNWIAQNRYRWFGKRAACWVPTPELKSRFLD